MAVIVCWDNGGIVDVMDMPPVDGPIVVKNVHVDENGTDFDVVIEYESVPIPKE